VIKKIKSRNKKTVISLELRDNFFKICEVTFSKSNPAFRLISRKISSKENDDISREIARLLDNSKPFQRKVFLNIPRGLVMTRILRLPSVNDDEIKSMIKLESFKKTPYKDEDIISGHRIVEKQKDGYSNVLLAVVQTNVVERFVNILEKAGLIVEKIALGSECLFAWYSDVIKKKDPPPDNAALLNIEAESIDIDIIEKGKLVFSRAFSLKGEDLSAINKNAVDEIKKTFTACRRERNSVVDKIYISGAGNRIKGFEELFKKEFSAPLEYIPQTENIELDRTEEADLGKSSFVELIGLSLKNEDIKVDLLPEKMKKVIATRIFRKNLFKTTGLLLSIALVFLGIMAKKIHDKSHYLLMLNSEIKAMSPQVLKAEKIKEDMSIIEDALRKTPMAIGILSEIYTITPRGINFNLFDYESGKSLVLKGDAPSLEEIVKFVVILENSRYFENVKIKYTAKRDTAGKKATDFEIICLLSES